MDGIRRYGNSQRWADIVVYRGVAHWVEVAEHEAQPVDLVWLDRPHALNPPAESHGNEVCKRDSHLRPLIIRGRQRRPV